MFVCRFFLADCDQSVKHTRFDMQAPIATISATCNNDSIPPSLTTLVVVSPKRLSNTIGLPSYTTKRMIDVMLAATHAIAQNQKKGQKHTKTACLTWIERRLCYPKFEPRNQRHSNANPNECEHVCEPLPSRVRLECPISVHTPKGYVRCKGKPHEAIYIRLYHPAEGLGRVIVYHAA